jgi:hypothetical protein
MTKAPKRAFGILFIENYLGFGDWSLVLPGSLAQEREKRLSDPATEGRRV